MRYPAELTKKQVRYLVKNAYLSNKELAKKLGTTPNIIANYKYRARQEGLTIPKNKMPKIESSTMNVLREEVQKTQSKE